MLLYTTEEVAEILKLKPATVRGLIRDKRLIAIKIGTEYRITEEDLTEFLRQNRTA
ncbi:MAG: helix-turn-helix domain-containing protein [Methanospirillum sp.]|uniref:helix-turn-helix domain-containing protein n=1 Tax=Methanospirillum sp. TaxID=45200 RepID=UPI0023697DB8|nr:helix-turn-helix domain-containing protein [Methanospirillum sp.]MDD1728636.1 helix-turn-helix domain-containing protein [Methanospirillum sp.]